MSELPQGARHGMQNRLHPPSVLLQEAGTVATPIHVANVYRSEYDIKYPTGWKAVMPEDMYGPTVIASLPRSLAPCK
jgi:hypothetical protein